jgi:hypothetical protein
MLSLYFLYSLLDTIPSRALAPALQIMTQLMVLSLLQSAARLHCGSTKHVTRWDREQVDDENALWMALQTWHSD